MGSPAAWGQVAGGDHGSVAHPEARSSSLVRAGGEGRVPKKPPAAPQVWAELRHEQDADHPNSKTSYTKR